MIFEKNNTQFLTITLVGIICGSILTLLNTASIDAPKIYAFIISSCFIFCFSFNGNKTYRLLGTSLLSGLIISMATPFISDELNCVPLGFGALCNFTIVAYITQCFHWSYHQDNSIRCNYKTLFLSVWNTLGLLMTMSFFFIATWSLFLLTSVIFKNIGINQVQEFITSSNFIHFITPTLLSIGLAIGRKNNQIIENVRNILLLMSRILLPFLAFVTISYLIVAGTLALLDWQFLDGIYDKDTYISLAILGIILLNGVYQDGNEDWKYNKFIKWLVLIFITILPIFSVTTFLKTMADQALEMSLPVYLSPYFINIYIICLYSIGYAITVVIDREKLHLIPIFNITIAVIYIAINLVAIRSYPFVCTPYTGILPGIAIPQDNNTVKDQMKTINNRIKKQSKETSLKWAPVNNNKDTSNWFIAGFRRNNPIYICKAPFKDGIHPGEIYKGKCKITYGGESHLQKVYQVLTGTSDYVKWEYEYFGTGNDKNFIAGFEPINSTNFNGRLRPLSLCRTIYKNRIHVGKQFTGYCEINDGNKEITQTFYQILKIAE